MTSVRRFTSMDVQAVNFVKAIYLHPARLSVADVYRILKEEAPSRGWKIGSLSTCYRIISTIPDGEKIYGREGEKAYERASLRQTRERFPNLIPDGCWGQLDNHDDLMDLIFNADAACVNLRSTFTVDGCQKYHAEREGVDSIE